MQNTGQISALIYAPAKIRCSGMALKHILSWKCCSLLSSAARLFVVTLASETSLSRALLQPHGQRPSPVEVGKQPSRFLFLTCLLRYYFYLGSGQENLVLLLRLYNICFFFFSFISLHFSPLRHITVLSWVRKGP